MDPELREKLALELFVQLAPQAGVLAHEIGGGHWEELLCSNYAIENRERKAFQKAVRNLVDRCLFATDVALKRVRAARGDAPTSLATVGILASDLAYLAAKKAARRKEGSDEP